MNMYFYVDRQLAQRLSEPSNLQIYKVDGTESHIAILYITCSGTKLRKRQLAPVLFYLAVCRLFFTTLAM